MEPTATPAAKKARDVSPSPTGKRRAAAAEDEEPAAKRAGKVPSAAAPAPRAEPTGKRHTTAADELAGKRSAPERASSLAVAKYPAPTRLPPQGRVKQPGKSSRYRPLAAAPLRRYAAGSRRDESDASAAMHTGPVIDVEQDHQPAPPGTALRLEKLGEAMRHDLPVLFAADLPFRVLKAATRAAGNRMIDAANAANAKSIAGAYEDAVERIELDKVVGTSGMAAYFGILQADAERAGLTVSVFDGLFCDSC